MSKEAICVQHRREAMRGGNLLVPLRERLISTIETHLTPPFDWGKLYEVDLIVVHGGSGKYGVATAMLFQDFVDAAKRRVQGKTFDEVDFRPLVLFTGMWSKNTPQERRPKSRTTGEVLSQAAYMREVAIGWGAEDALLLTEEDSQTTEEGVINALKIIEERGLRPKTILFISAHFLPLRTLLLWEHYAKDVSLLSFGSLIVRDDDLDPYDQCKDTHQRSFRQNDYVKELAKTVVTFLQLQLQKR